MSHIALELGKQAASLGVKSAYGEPVDVDGVSVTPVALTLTGFAGAVGEGGDASRLGGEGGTGGGVAVPFGVYVRREEGLRFEPNIITLLAVLTPFVWVAGRAFTRIVRVLKK